uniref:Uncharacterized protein n=1 Tax=Strombidium rassoulzadegani TaxID=1082188 RepID=A0A7S3CPK5_9SPIT|mmetsp:Transcript_2226/g.3854  ORF Transcript_2226/g.3854 Transcript_2226/m.3854 type:complete len:120 (+) Transcript_2226:183-542(+)
MLHSYEELKDIEREINNIDLERPGGKRRHELLNDKQKSFVARLADLEIEEEEREELLIEKQLGSKYMVTKRDLENDKTGSTLQGINNKLNKQLEIENLQSMVHGGEGMDIGKGFNEFLE